ncbi:hypothetical protein IC757_11380 [Wenzhouxiangella sp. AB-CW3]|uniref:hypothetical protein n=1 Tax=Wenzhouxiangella sp. AB-CW3 TaxID=2771012 RepID=UPI00168B949F|nr:hypothetical protein [Wenzhouxiangella sp. AB-CW3]QOC21640.1 hypothetical protein IC757_11380 [Wenzhouxiangella sp. AB-CW3]
MPAETRHRSIMLPVVISSLLLHAAILLLPQRQWPGAVDTPEPRSIHLLPAPAAPEPALEHPVEPRSPETRTESQPVPDTQPPPDEAEQAAKDVSPEQPTTHRAADLHRQALEQAREVPADTAEEGSHLRFHGTPRLPGAPGRLNEQLGTVSSRVDRWQSTDGSYQARTVLGDGSVICTSIRAPTMQEFFNPWMSAAVAMHRRCGRERPEPSDTDDPWQRPVSRGARPSE